MYAIANRQHGEVRYPFVYGTIAEAAADALLYSRLMGYQFDIVRI